MSASNGPGINTNQLVFDYDMYNTLKSWKGKPTTNLVDPNWSAWSYDSSGYSSSGTRTITSSFACTITDSSTNTRQYIYISSGISASTTYTFSVQYQKVYGTPTLRFQIQAYNSSTYLSTMSFATTAELGVTDIDGWQTAKITLTTPSSCNRICWFMQDGDDYTGYTHSFMLANPQCEQQSFATPFVSGTRSSSQAILDLTNNNTITASSLTYPSDGTFSFVSGSSNYMTGTMNSSYQSSTNSINRSWEVWTKPAATQSTAGLFGHVVSAGCSYYCNGGVCISSGNYAFNWYDDSSYQFLDSGVAATSGQYAHVVGTYTTSDNKTRIYVNGVLKATYGSATNLDYGGSGTYYQLGYLSAAGYYFSGVIPVAKYYYNKSLTADEVLQNFQALRGRFGV